MIDIFESSDLLTSWRLLQPIIGQIMAREVSIPNVSGGGARSDHSASLGAKGRKWAECDSRARARAVGVPGDRVFQLLLCLLAIPLSRLSLLRQPRSIMSPCFLADFCGCTIHKLTGCPWQSVLVSLRLGELKTNLGGGFRWFNIFQTSVHT